MSLIVPIPLGTQWDIDEVKALIAPLADSAESLIVHVLFIDIVGYSKLCMAAQRDATEELKACVMKTLTYGQALETGTLTCLDTGDGMALVFEGNPTAPAFAALELAQATGSCAKHSVRMGLHSGPAIRVRDINDRQNFKGVGLNVTQRVMDAAGCGQIMMTQHYADVLSCYEGWSNLIFPRGVRKVKHGLRLRICELWHESQISPVTSQMGAQGIAWAVRSIVMLILFLLTMEGMMAASVTHAPAVDTQYRRLGTYDSAPKAETGDWRVRA
jgi:class 3 adenylate cyclase